MVTQDVKPTIGQYYMPMVAFSDHTCIAENVKHTATAKQ